MFRSATGGKIKLFADDTSILIVASDIKVLFSLANDIVYDVNQWLVCNKLTINLEKNNYMIFKPSRFKNNVITNLNLTITVNSILLARTSLIKYLGMWLDKQLNWDMHIAQLI